MTTTARRSLTTLTVTAGAALLTVTPAYAQTAPPADPITVTVDSATIGEAPGTVVLTGTVTCDTDVQAFVYGDVAQVQGLDIARDFFGTPVPCSPTGATWTATTVGSTRMFLPLDTHVTVSADYCTPEVCYTDTTSAVITLPS
jgi:hypothetical protein